MRFTFASLHLGTNQGPGAAALSYAEKDAADMWRHFVGSAGAGSDARSALLLRPTRRELRVMLRRLIHLQPDALVLTISGHASTLGILLADDLMTFAELATWLKAVGASHTLLLIDTCHAGAFLKKAAIGGLGGLEEDFVTLLRRAVPGLRVLAAARADEFSRESHVLRNGIFSWGVLRAMESARADLDYGIVSAAAIFRGAMTVLRRLLPASQRPIASGPLHDFPVCRSQETMVGAGEFSTATFGRDVLNVEFALEGRRFIPTRLAWSVANANGRVLGQGSVAVNSTDHVASFVYDIPMPLPALERDVVSRLYNQLGADAPVTCTLELQDAQARVVERGTVQGGFRSR